MKAYRIIGILITLAFVFMVSSCGGGGSSDSSNSTSPQTSTYTIALSASGVYGTLVLQNNGGDDLAIAADGTYDFSTAVADGASYNVTVLSNAEGLNCAVTNGSGTVSSMSVTNVSVACSVAPPVPCDTGLAINSTSATDAAKAMGICMGLVSAEYTQPDGSPTPLGASATANFELGHGILTNFGTNVTNLEGSAMLDLSTGTARNTSDADYGGADFKKGYTSNLPSGWPVTTFSPMSGACPNGTAAYDGIALHVKLRAPVWANAYRFQSKFYSSDYSAFLCQTYNDYAIVRSVPAPAGAIQGNVMYDANGSPFTVNSTYTMEECTPVSAYTCPSGIAGLVGTEYISNGASDWITTTVPITGGSTIELYFTIWDEDDDSGNSTILFDGFEWLRQ